MVDDPSFHLPVCPSLRQSAFPAQLYDLPAHGFLHVHLLEARPTKNRHLRFAPLLILQLLIQSSPNLPYDGSSAALSARDNPSGLRTALHDEHNLKAVASVPVQLIAPLGSVWDYRSGDAPWSSTINPLYRVSGLCARSYTSQQAQQYTNYAMPPTSSSRQRALISEFKDLTGSTERHASRVRRA